MAPGVISACIVWLLVAVDCSAPAASRREAPVGVPSQCPVLEGRRDDSWAMLAGDARAAGPARLLRPSGREAAGISPDQGVVQCFHGRVRRAGRAKVE